MLPVSALDMKPIASLEHIIEVKWRLSHREKLTLLSQGLVFAAIGI
jgi:hypothetical protein